VAGLGRAPVMVAIATAEVHRELQADARAEGLLHRAVNAATSDISAPACLRAVHSLSCVVGGSSSDTRIAPSFAKFDKKSSD